MPTIHTNHQGHIAIELRRIGRSLKMVEAILGHDGKLRRVRKFSASQFDKDYHPLPTAIDHVAFRWLESHNNNQRLLSDGALKELIMLLIIKDNTVHAKFAVDQEDACQSVVDSIEGSCELIKSVADLTEYSGKDLAELYNGLRPLSSAKAGYPLKESKEKLAQKVWELCKAILPTIEKTIAKAEKPASTEVKKQKGGKKMSDGMRGKCRAFMTAGKVFTIEELATAMGVEAKVARTKMGLITRDPGIKHVGLVTEKLEDGSYKVIQVPEEVEAEEKAPKSEEAAE